MTLVQGHGHSRRKHSSAAPSVAPFDSFPSSESGDELSNQPSRLLRAKPLVANAFATTSVPKYSENDLQRIFKTVFEAQAPVPAPSFVSALASVLAPTPVLAPAPIVAKAPREKLKAHSPEVYYGKSHMDCYHFNH